MNPAKERSTEGFDLPTWRSRVADWWRESAPDLPGVMQRLGLHTAYGALVASAWLPLLAAYADDPGRAVTALVGLVSGVGSNLVANVVQGAYDQANAPRQAESEVAERPELRSEYQQLLNGLDVLDVARAALSADWTPFEAQLREELARMGGQVRLKTKGGAVVFGDVKVKYGDFVGRDKIVHLHFGPPEPDLAPLREAYLRLLVERHGRLPLRGVDVQASDATAQAQRPRLAQVYVELNTSSSVVENDEGGRHKPRHVEEAVALGKEDAAAEARRLSALEAVLENRHLILLGAPGSGKSTFVCHLACCLGLGQQEPGQGWLERLSGWPEAEAGALPLVVTLRDFARWAGAQGLNRGTARALDDFIASWLGEHSLGELTGSLRQALRGGQAVVLLDGLDEVPTPELRALVRDAVSDFGLVYERARLLVTCRTLSYQDPRWRLDPTRFPSFELAPFDEEQIDRFIAAWYAELAALKAVRAEDVDALATKLRGAVRQPDLWRLASNPLLLTVMALVHAYQGRLPEARALLYEECTDLLLWRWEQVKWQADLAATPGVRALLADAHLQEVDLKAALWELAFDAHSASADGGDEEATIDIPEERLLRALRGLHPDRSWDWAAEVVTQIKERAGLLVERDLEVYAFPHRTFQEYLAGCHLSVQADFGQRAAALLEEAAFWREAVLLAVGRLVHVMGDLPRPLSLAAELCPVVLPVSEREWQAAWLAGEVLLEVGAERAGRTAMGHELLERVRVRLAALLAGGHLAPRERAEAGVVLGKLGDPRLGVTLLPSRPGVTAPPPREAGGTEGRPLPDLLWCPVPGGTLQMGSAKGDELSYSREYGPDGQPVPVQVAPFFLAAYPVTVAQFRPFVRGDGYTNLAYWTPDGWKEKEGQGWTAPRYWEDPRWHLDNHPVVGVSWYEAVAYCHWLTNRLQEPGIPWRVWVRGQIRDLAALDDEEFVPLVDALRPSSFVIRLPTEAEWEWAARGPGAPRWTWGDEWEDGLCNSRESGVGRTSAVGAFPGSAARWLAERGAPVHDLAGNVLEWCATRWQEKYPLPRVDEWDDRYLDGTSPRVLRGGSWFGHRDWARSAYRYWGVPNLRLNRDGFRCCVGSTSSL